MGGRAPALSFPESLSPGPPKGGPLSFQGLLRVDNSRMDEIEAPHARATAEGKDTYVDPTTGFDVFTAAYLLRRGVCCGSGCRHCPFDHENVEVGAPSNPSSSGPPPVGPSS